MSPGEQADPYSSLEALAAIAHSIRKEVGLTQAELAARIDRCSLTGPFRTCIMKKGRRLLHQPSRFSLGEAERSQASKRWRLLLAPGWYGSQLRERKSRLQSTSMSAQRGASSWV
jgi:hypothetical protein